MYQHNDVIRTGVFNVLLLYLQELLLNYFTWIINHGNQMWTKRRDNDLTALSIHLYGFYFMEYFITDLFWDEMSSFITGKKSSQDN